MILTRDLINKNIEFFDYYHSYLPPKKYGFEELSSYIDHYKNLFQLNDLECGDSLLIGLKPSVNQTAAFFAASELGLVVTIANPTPNAYDSLVLDPKIEKLLPIDCFLIDSISESEKNQFFKKISGITIETEFIKDFNFTKNNKINVDEDSPILKCLSSGSNNELITHTHNFFHALIKRNSIFLYGNVSVISNLNHGSSLATFYLPALVGKDVQQILNFNVDLFSRLKKTDLEIDHMMISYPNLIEEYLEKLTTPQTTIWTLSALRAAWKESISNKIKDVISIFGCNETSGPVLVNKLSNLNFDTYNVVDDFYDVKLNSNSELEITTPIYNKTIIPGDLFEKVDNSYKYLGRPDLNRINGLVVDFLKYQKIVKDNLDGDLIIDQLSNRIYLAIYQKYENLENKIGTIDYKIRTLSNNLHFIHIHSIINKVDFLLEIGIFDKSKLIEYFRSLN